MKPNTLTLFVSMFTAVGISITACNNGPSTQTTATLKELPDPTADTLSDWSAVPAGLHASFVSIDRRYPKSVNPQVEVKRKDKVTGWKGERVSAQVLLWTAEDVNQVQLDFSDFTSGSASLPAATAQARFVRYVMTDEFAEGCGHRKPEDFSASLSADMLDSLQSFDLEGKAVRPVWVTVDIPQDAEAGVYKTTLEVSSEGKKLQALELDLEVINRELPPPSEWTFHLDQWQHPSAVARVEGVEVWSDAHFEAMKPVMQLLADAGQKVITATLNKDPWNVQTYDPYADMITWTKQEDGSWTYDYTVFDRWVQFMMDLGINKMINCYSIIPWNNEIHYKDMRSGEQVNVKADPGTRIFEELWKPFLVDFAEHLKQKGWLEITNIAMDERDPQSMDAAFQLIHSVAPDLGVAFADNHKTYKKYPNSADISVSAYHPFDREDLLDRKSRRLNTTFYVCCADPFPNQFTFSDPAESTYLAWYAMASGFDGLLRWAFNSWVENPVLDSRFRTWPAGDTYIVYPGGRSSIRYERMLEGIQDFEKITIMRKELEEAGNNADLVRLNQAVEKMKTVERTATWNADLNGAKKLLNEL
jgi:hypothetical protein